MPHTIVRQLLLLLVGRERRRPRRGRCSCAFTCGWEKDGPSSSSSSFRLEQGQGGNRLSVAVLLLLGSSCLAEHVRLGIVLLLVVVIVVVPEEEEIR